MQAVIDNLLTTYQRSGKGRQVLLLHGWGDSSAGWRAFAGGLAGHYDVIVPDLPGFGGTQAPAGAWGLDEYADFVSAFVKKLGLKPYAILGHSNGGAIAIRGIANDKLSAEKLVLLASAGIRGEYKGRNKALRLAAKTGKLLSAPLPARTKKKLRRQVYTTIGSDMLVAEHLQESFKKVVNDDVRPDSATLNLPTLLIYGEQDTQAPVRYGELFHQAINGSTLEILPGADHFLHQSHEARVLHLVEEFLA